MLKVIALLLIQAVVIWFYGWAFADLWWMDFTDAVKWSLLLFGAKTLILPKIVDTRPRLSFTETVGVYLATLAIGGILFGGMWLWWLFT